MKSFLLLQYIIPYLEYELKILSNKNEIQTLFGIRDEAYFIKETQNNYAYGDISDIKPILIPLSDFYDINDPAFINTNFDIPTQLVLVDLCSKKQHYSGIIYSDMQEFLKYHIDIFNLIEKGLAISIHDVEKQIDEINLCKVLKDADLLESAFIRWIVKSGWMYISPLKIYQHKNKEIYKTKIELNDIFLLQRYS